MGEFQKSVPNEWGWVESGAEVTDTTTGVVYRLENQQVWIVLKAPDGKTMRFEPFQRIDHHRFEIRLRG